MDFCCPKFYRDSNRIPQPPTSGGHVIPGYAGSSELRGRAVVPPPPVRLVQRVVGQSNNIFQGPARGPTTQRGVVGDRAGLDARGLHLDPRAAVGVRVAVDPRFPAVVGTHLPVGDRPGLAVRHPDPRAVVGNRTEERRPPTGPGPRAPVGHGVNR